MLGTAPRNDMRYKTKSSQEAEVLGAFFLSDVGRLPIFFSAAPIAAAAVSVAYNCLL